MERKHYVYHWIRPDTGDVFYVGLGSTARRDRDLKSNTHFRNIIAKLKRSGLEPNVVRVAESLTRDEAIALEVAEIARIGRKHVGGPLTNSTDGGEGAPGWNPTEETRIAMSAAHRKRFEDPKTRAALSEATRKRFEDPAARAAHSAALRRRYKEDPYAREAASARLRKRYENPAEREAKSAEMLRYWEMPGVREAISAAQREYWNIPSVREANSARQIKRFEDPAVRDALNSALRKRWDDPSAHEAMSERLRLAPPRKNNTSGFKGVSFYKASSKWAANITECGKARSLGYFDTPNHAARAYDAAAVEAWGIGNCYLNFPEDFGLPANNNGASALVAA